MGSATEPRPRRGASVLICALGEREEAHVIVGVDTQRFYEQHGFRGADPDNGERAYFYEQEL